MQRMVVVDQLRYCNMRRDDQSSDLHRAIRPVVDRSVIRSTRYKDRSVALTPFGAFRDMPAPCENNRARWSKREVHRDLPGDGVCCIRASTALTTVFASSGSDIEDRPAE